MTLDETLQAATDRDILVVDRSAPGGYVSDRLLEIMDQVQMAQVPMRRSSRYLVREGTRFEESPPSNVSFVSQSEWDAVAPENFVIGVAMEWI